MFTKCIYIYICIYSVNSNELSENQTNLSVAGEFNVSAAGQIHSGIYSIIIIIYLFSRIFIN